MSRYNTGNPIDSGALKDLSDNAKNLDVAMNSDNPTFKDRFNRTRATFFGLADAAAETVGQGVASSARAITKGLMPVDFDRVHSNFFATTLAPSVINPQRPELMTPNVDLVGSSGLASFSFTNLSSAVHTKGVVKAKLGESFNVSVTVKPLGMSGSCQFSLVAYALDSGYVYSSVNYAPSVAISGSSEITLTHTFSGFTEESPFIRFGIRRVSNTSIPPVNLNLLNFDVTLESGGGATKTDADTTSRSGAIIDFYAGNLPSAAGDLSITYLESSELKLRGFGYLLGGAASKTMVAPALLSSTDNTALISVVVECRGVPVDFQQVFQQIGTNRLDITLNGSAAFADGMGTFFNVTHHPFQVDKNETMVLSALYTTDEVLFFKNNALVGWRENTGLPTAVSSTLMGGQTSSRDVTQYIKEVRSYSGSCDIDTFRGVYNRLKQKYAITKESMYSGIDKTGNLGIQYCATSLSGEVLAVVNERHLQSPASITKVATLLIAIGVLNPFDEITVISNDISQDTLLAAGDKISVLDAMFAAMLVSSNTSANALARYAGDAIIPSGGIDATVDKMNELTRRLGMMDTHFVNASGMYNAAQKTTAYDMCLLGLAALKNSSLAAIMSTTTLSIKINSTTQTITSSVSNIGVNGVTGGKTGTISSPTVGTNNVLNLVGNRYVVCTLNAPTPTSRFEMNNAVIAGIKKHSDINRG